MILIQPTPKHFQHTRRKVRVESDQLPTGQHQAPLESEISKPQSTPVEPIFTSVAAESSTVATEALNKEKVKRQDVDGLADELAQRFQEAENEAVRREEAERKMEVYQSKAAATKGITKEIQPKG
ncbi:hypothetical protein L1987_63974 [Smallanthus sonchifolius]|uniref:Uncharacterized protein n=2 Tax=Smallanthus sonchifolius TaxID=185202 RepID=A0ACB9CEM3_9ASTR|nr:hypothetical protein L1987_63972 [Smallanthus sonchifolius]KAI3732766.1 hypothetical protein L1987_63974 [Smallanthus sonchifolius]